MPNSTSRCCQCTTDLDGRSDTLTQDQSNLESNLFSEKQSGKNGPPPERVRSQDQANNFVIQEWTNNPDVHPYHFVASQELTRLFAAYNRYYVRPCGNGRLHNTAPFTVGQLYTAYFNATAAEGSVNALIFPAN